MDDYATLYDPFEKAYTRGIVKEPTIATEGGEEPSVGPPRALLDAQEPFALRGCVLTPERKIEGGYVVVGDDRISEVGEGEPDSSLRAVDTGGVILPGLIDLHNHPEHDVFAAWEPPSLYENRYQWRDSYEYARVIKSPQSNLRLYGQTTRAAHALSLGILVGLGADWLPSGSPSLLADLKVVRRALWQQRADITSKRLVEMHVGQRAHSQTRRVHWHAGAGARGRYPGYRTAARRPLGERRGG